MRRIFSILLSSAIVAGASILGSSTVFAQSFELPTLSATKKITDTKLYSDISQVPVGGEFNLLVSFSIKEHWHLYWKNPGAIGDIFKIKWVNLPDGWTMGEWTWSTPSALTLSGITNFVFENQAFIKIPISVSSDAQIGKVKLVGNAEWLVCNDENCLPEHSELSVELEVTLDKQTAANLEIFKKAEEFFPKSGDDWSGEAIRENNMIRLTLTPPENTKIDPEKLQFFPSDTRASADSPYQKWTKNADNTLSVSLPVSDQEFALQGVLKTSSGSVDLSAIFQNPKQIVVVKSDDKKQAQASEQILSATNKLTWGHWTLAKQEEALNAGKIVYIDFTASWCVTCQVNKRVYSDEALIKKLNEAGVVTLKADWTSKNTEIAVELEKYKRTAVPVNVFLKKGQEPVILGSVFAGPTTVSDGLDKIFQGVGDTGDDATKMSFVELLLFALLGGIILNLMPCVFPVLGLKIMHFVGKAGSDTAKIKKHGLVFGLGVLVSFWILAGILIALRAGGEQLGWGFQMQSPIFVFAMVVLMLVFGLSMSGVFEFGVSATGVGGNLTQKSGYLGSFFSGVLAVIIATPCAAPFLSTALAAALTLDTISSLSLFTTIAIGLALPYVLLSFFPKLLKFLPKPGEWMESFKQAMAFLLYAPAAYFAWVLISQIQDSLIQRDVLLSLSVIALSCWIYGRWGVAWKSARTKIIAYMLSGILFFGSLAYVCVLLLSL